MSRYAERIRGLLAESATVANVRHVEAYIRLEHGTLDHLSKQSFKEEVALAVECIALDGLANAEELAESYGL